MQKDSYCSVIASHNQRIIQPTSFNYGCSCRSRAESPLDNKCLTANIVYKRVVSAPSKLDKCFGIAETSFKDRLRNHTRYCQLFMELPKLVFVSFV